MATLSSCARRPPPAARRPPRTPSGSTRAPAASRGTGLLDWAGVIPQGAVVGGVKFGWNNMWKVLMAELAPQDEKGSYVRPPDAFMKVVGTDQGAPADGQYVLYTGNACPWCSRVAIAAALRNVPESSLQVVPLIDDAERASRGGWVMASGRDPVFGSKDLREVYDACQPGGYFGRCTAPLLVAADTKAPIANNSGAIIRGIDAMPGDSVTLRPSTLAAECDKWAARITAEVNNGVYRCGFSTSQAAYDVAANDLYRSLDELDALLATRRFVAGPSITEADVFLLPTMLRYDDAYATLFRCTGRRIAMLPNIAAWREDMLRVPGVSDTYDPKAGLQSYFGQLFPLNPSGIVPSAAPRPLVSDAELAKREELGGGAPVLAPRE